MVRALARNARDPGFEFRFRLDFSPPVTFGDELIKPTVFPTGIWFTTFPVLSELGDEFLREGYYVPGLIGV